jgi:hypothetical protein
MYGNPNQNMDDKFFIKDFLSFFKRSILGGISPRNHHLLILDGHGSHVSL